MTPALRTFRIAALAVAVVALAGALAAGAWHQVLLINSPAASGSIEWDFYYSYARDAKRISYNLPPLDEYRGPLYPLTIALAGIVLPFLSAFTIAKLVAALCAGAAVYAVYRIGEETLDAWWGLAVAAATAATAPFLLAGFLVGTDMFFAALCLWSIYWTLLALSGSTRAAAAAGLVSGLAMATRWNAVFLPAAAVASVAIASDLPARERLKLAAIFVAGFLIPVVPWLAFNARVHGSPFYNRNEVNASLGIYDGGVSFNSLSEAVAYAPRYFVKRWASNVAVYAGRVGASVLPFGVAAAAGLVVLVARGRRRVALWAVVLFAAALFVVNAIGPYVIRQYLVAIPLVFVAAAAVCEWLASFERTARFARPVVGVAWTAGVLWLVAGGVAAVGLVRASESKQVTAQSMVGTKPATPLLGDWDGDGRDEVGVARDGDGYKTFYLFNTYTDGPATWIAAFGPARATPIAGHWAPRGPDSIGCFNQGAFFLTYAVFSGRAAVTSTFGDAGGAPVVGDWNGDGRDTFGTFRDGVFTLTDQTVAPFMVRTFAFGAPGDQPIAGDWDGDGIDTVGVYRDGVFTLTNRMAPPFDDAWQVRTDLPGTIPLAGDWDGDGRDAPALFAADGTFYFLDKDGPKQWKVDLDHLADLPVAGE